MRVRYCGEMPEETTYLTSGKWYEVSRCKHTKINESFFEIIDDYGKAILISTRKCPHLDMEKWEVEA